METANVGLTAQEEKGIWKLKLHKADGTVVGLHKHPDYAYFLDNAMKIASILELQLEGAEAQLTVT